MDVALVRDQVHEIENFTFFSQRRRLFTFSFDMAVPPYRTRNTEDPNLYTAVVFHV